MPTTARNGASIHPPGLLMTVALMLGGTIYLFGFAHANKAADQGLAKALFWALSAGLVCRIGFAPLHRVGRLRFTRWTCFSSLVSATCLRWGV